MTPLQKGALITVGTAITGLGGYLVFKAIKKARKTKAELRGYDKKTYEGGSGKINLYEVADSIANGLGINKSILNPQSWTENDTDVYNAIRVVPKALIGELVSIYYTKYKRNLRSDLNEFLDTELYAKIKNLLY